MNLTLILRQCLPYYANSTRHIMGEVSQFYDVLDDILHVVKTPEMGEVRLTWWREALDGTRADEAQSVILAQKLVALLEQHVALKEPCIEAVHHWGHLLYAQPIPTSDEMCALAQNNYMFLFGASQVAAQCPEVDLYLAQAAAGAYGLTALLFSFAGALRKGQILLPLNEGIDESALLDGHVGLGERALWLKICERAQAQYDLAFDLAKNRAHKIALLPLASVPAQLKRLRAMHDLQNGCEPISALHSFALHFFAFLKA